MKAVGPFTQKLWMTVQLIYEQIINCIYVKFLADETLPHKCFAHYLSQDVLYIIDDSSALANEIKVLENVADNLMFTRMEKPMKLFFQN